MQTTLKCTWFSVLATVGVSVLSSCASVPTQLQGEYANISPAHVQADQFASNVRWGGVLVETRNEKDRTCFEVLSRALDRTMRPLSEDRTEGRFIACTGGFHDPEVYAKGRDVTITGTIRNLEEHKIEAFDYRYPVVEITDMVLWEERDNVVVYNQFYDPFYDPYFWGYPYWGYYPYYYPYYRHPWPYAGPRIAPRGNSTANKRGR
jgi:outer membrane lipoprotein